MPIDIEQQIANYFEWLDHSSGTTLHRSADMVELDDHEPEVIAIQRAVPTTSRILMMVVAAAVLVVAVAVVVVRSRTADDGYATGQPAAVDASWYVIDPSGTYGSLGDGTIVNLGETGLACRHYNAATETCPELVGQRSVSYGLDGGETVTVTTDQGPEPSTMWQMLQSQGQSAEVAGHSGFASLEFGVGFEAAPGVRVVVLGTSTALQTLMDIAASLTLVHEHVVIPIVFGDSAPRGGEFPFDSVGDRYYAGYVDLANSCVGSFGVPWNGGEAKCVEVSDDNVTVTVASPSPAGTILIAALPSATSSAEITLQDGNLATPPVAVPGFAPKLLFIDLDGAIPSHLTARDSSGAVIGETDIISTGGAALGYLSGNPDAVPRTYYSTEHPMTVWPLAASSGPYTSNAGYGMTPCDSGSWTKLAVLASATRWEYSYQGTLCTFTTLGHPIGDTIASCASMSAGPNYAQCKLLPDPNDGATPTGTDSNGSAADLQPEDAALLPATPSDLPQIFTDQISAVSLLGSDQYSDDSVSVALSKDLDPRVTCFRISLADASSEGCLDQFLLTTGLAYGAFERADGPIEVVGIVPDDVASVEIAGRVIPVQHNVWHYTGEAGDDLSFTVRSANGSLTAAVH
ncbi:MAG: hypothetical protein JJD93_04475 [Ilumatobacteraceae bacterium]|nr:hypothetical protein [Ilumatobacteraceae bacterium]